jgi:hypothetical protein
MIAFASERGEDPYIYIAHADGSGRPSKVWTPPLAGFELDWSLDRS